ncbi:hypothetical protein KW798_03905 [Candidatus Parcubacteria bacterium]|nr:hypothetical protein [Candidatus Parcubacteria bacterium]
MNKEVVLEEIKNKKPRIVYISGKTCTGKTTFANDVLAQGYGGIELDKIVTSAVIEPFNVQPPNEGYVVAYRDIGPSEQIAAFISAVRKEIKEKLVATPVVIDGAIARARILKEIFSDEFTDFYFVYFHPVHFDLYKERIRNRFITGVPDNSAGLPKDFWALVNKKDFDEFMQKHTLNEGLEKAIDEFTHKSMEESKHRRDHFKESFPGLHVVEV